MNISHKHWYPLMVVGLLRMFALAVTLLLVTLKPAVADRLEDQNPQ